MGMGTMVWECGMGMGTMIWEMWYGMGYGDNMGVRVCGMGMGTMEVTWA